MKTDLYRELRSRKNLRSAWGAVRTSGIASRNEETRNEILDFDRDDERRVNRIYRHLLKKDYEFAPSRAVPIKKKGKDPRPIVVAPVQDRVVRRAILQILQEQQSIRDIVQTPWSFGGIKDGGVRHAIKKACTAVSAGAKYYLRSDVESFFSRIPRKKAVSVLTDRLSDPEFGGILEEATIIELDNVSCLPGHVAELYPSPEEGVAQGFCLSPLMGNALLHQFDKELNSRGVTCLRYIDDFIILGESNKTVWDAFKIGCRLLHELGMECYHPEDKPDKAAHGSTEKGFLFLGCHITPHQISPSKEARQKLIQSVQKRTNYACAELRKASSTGAINPDVSLLHVLRELNLSIRAWGNQYSFCNCPDVFDNIDQRIDECLRNLIGTYSVSRTNADAQLARRLLGVHLIQDSKHTPILPLSE